MEHDSELPSRVKAMMRILDPRLVLQWSSKVCIQNQSLLSRTVRVRRQLNLTGGTAS